MGNYPPVLNRKARHLWGTVSAGLRVRVGLAVLLLAALMGGAVHPAGAASPRALDTGSSALALSIGAADGAISWADLDNNGYPDLLVSGLGYDGQNFQRNTIFFYNNNGVLAQVDLGLTRVEASSQDWADYDNDGYPDLLLTGKAGSVGFAGIYHNVPHTPTAGFPSTRTLVLATQLDPIYQGAGVWGDYDNDGRPDVLLTGYTYDAVNNRDVPVSRIYHNDGNGSFSLSSINVMALGGSTAAWGDFDNDGYTDFAIRGLVGTDPNNRTPTTLVYRNNHSGAFAAPISLTGLWGGTLNWIDYNKNGILDLLVTGNQGNNAGTNIIPKTILYKTVAGSPPTFTPVSGTNLPNVWTSTVSVGDYNNDGYPDLLLNGMTLSGSVTDIFVNTPSGTSYNGIFTAANAGLPNNSGITAAWGDFNRDKTLDAALTGVAVGDRYYTDIYLNTAAPVPPVNNPPGQPSIKAACLDTSQQRLQLDWNAPTDDHTPQSGLTYNLRMGTTPNGIERVSPLSDLTSGYHRLVDAGNLFGGTSAFLRNLPQQVYYWSVQALDSAYAGGPFSSTGSFDLSTRVAADDQLSTTAAHGVTFNLLANDNNTVYAPLSIYSRTNPLHGDITVNPDGSLTYTPRSCYTGPDRFTYYAIGNTLYCSNATVDITVTAEADTHVPTGIALSNNAVSEGQPVGSLVGTLSTNDLDQCDSFTYSLISNPDSAFKISGNQLQTNKLLTGPTSYPVTVQTKDAIGNLFTSTFTIQVGANPLTLSNQSTAEGQPANSLVGTLSVTNPLNLVGPYSYTLAPYNGQSYDNGSFQISGSQLLTVGILDHRLSPYQIGVQVTDSGGRMVDKLFSISVQAVAPTLVWKDAGGSHLGPAQVTMSADGSPMAFALTLAGTDQHTLTNPLTWRITQGAGHGTANVSGTTASGQNQNGVTYTPAAKWAGTDSFVVQISDSYQNTAEITVQVTVQANPRLYLPVILGVP